MRKVKKVIENSKFEKGLKRISDDIEICKLWSQSTYSSLFICLIKLKINIKIKKIILSLLVCNRYIL